MADIGQSDRSAPVMIWDDAGNIYDEEENPLMEPNQDIFLNLQLLTSHGYAVLFPSIPVNCHEGGPECDSQAEDYYMHVLDPVEGALSEAARIRAVDRKRVGILGHSHAAFTALCLSSQLGELSAVVAIAGVADLPSSYGTFDPRIRFTQHPQLSLNMVSLEETPQAYGLVAPPWRDYERAFRNSPLAHVEEINASLLLIYGDRDPLGMQNGEQMLTAMYRLHKKAELVRYWGEGHNIESPANIRDLWTRIYAWFDEYLKPAQPQH